MNSYLMYIYAPHTNSVRNTGSDFISGKSG